MDEKKFKKKKILFSRILNVNESFNNFFNCNRLISLTINKYCLWYNYFETKKIQLIILKCLLFALIIFKEQYYYVKDKFNSK